MFQSLPDDWNIFLWFILCWWRENIVISAAYLTRTATDRKSTRRFFLLETNIIKSASKQHAKQYEISTFYHSNTYLNYKKYCNSTGTYLRTIHERIPLGFPIRLQNWQNIMYSCWRINWKKKADLVTKAADMKNDETQE